MINVELLSAIHDSAVGRCRLCGSTAKTLLDLGSMPPANWLMSTHIQAIREFPLVLEKCDCGNFQLGYCLDAEDLYTHYNYATPNSPSLSEHYSRLIRHLEQNGYLTPDSNVVEIGSNVGRFLAALRPRVKSVLGIDPARNIAEIANRNGIRTLVEFFDRRVARDVARVEGTADLVVARHCLAHNRDPYEILDGIIELLAPDGALLIENAYAMSTLQQNEFDQIYHEHMFYFTLHAVRTMLERRGLALVDVMFSDIHGGSIACVAKRSMSNAAITSRIAAELWRERELLDYGLAQRFVDGTASIQAQLKSTIGDLRDRGCVIYAYGATAKGATLMNSIGLTSRDISYCADSTPIKQGKFIPKCGIEIVSEEWAFANPPDVFLLTAWNYKNELIAKARAAGLERVRFIVPVPDVTIV
ncbi:MAG TPA: methyltransferase domain-containing protein [Candidatus Baltobacteraceae bacterium]|nr:methyltransferase domain-containing protein [Candidatus Baltobacteraceae bacterium]